MHQHLQGHIGILQGSGDGAMAAQPFQICPFSQALRRSPSPQDHFIQVCRDAQPRRVLEEVLAHSLSDSVQRLLQPADNLVAQDCTVSGGVRGIYPG